MSEETTNATDNTPNTQHQNMSTGDFLRTIFPTPDNNEYVRFTVIDRRSEKPWPGITYWYTTKQLHNPEIQSVDDIITTNLLSKDIYFTPHAFTRKDPRNSVTKEDAAPTSQTCWVECDDDDIPPETFTPPPTITVETSPNRHHLYWILTHPIPISEVEKLNYRLTYGNNLTKDTGGWGITKLLRLPNTTSYKREIPTRVRIITHTNPTESGTQPCENTRIYNESAFNDLPLAPEKTDYNGHSELPDDTTLPVRAELLTKYPITVELQDIMDRARTDRSSAIWRAYHICYFLGLSETETYALLRNTANDKFAKDWRYNADDGLWNDIRRAFRMAKNPNDTPVLLRLKTIRATKGTPPATRRRQIAEEITKDLAQRGRLYYDVERREAMYYDGKEVMAIEKTSTPWKVLLNTRYHVTEGEDEYHPVNANLYVITVQTGEPVTPRYFSHFDTARKLLYINCNNGKMVRLDGSQINIIDNGSDGVLFKNTRLSEPWDVSQYQSITNYSPGAVYEPCETTLHDAIFAVPNYSGVDTSNAASPTQSAQLARIWFYSLFFPELLEARPHLVMNGPTESGKTMIFQLMHNLLNGPRSTVESVPDSQMNFETAISNAHHLFYDNVDTPNKWFTDAIAECATGIQFTRRLLYTTNESISYNVQCFLGLTTRDAWFARADVATRMIVLEVERREYKQNPRFILNRVRNNRNVLWSHLLLDLNKLVATVRESDNALTSPEHTVLRMAGFVEFIKICASSLPQYTIDANGIVNRTALVQSESALDHSILWQMIEKWLFEYPTNSGRWVSANMLYNGLQSAAIDLGSLSRFTKVVASTRSLAHHLKELIADMRKIIDVDIDNRPPFAKYKFTIREQENDDLKPTESEKLAAD